MALSSDDRLPDVTARSAPVPTSTYRIQLTPEWTFADTARLVPYLADLGVGWLYLSPFFKATPGSTHGYDVTDYSELNPELGGEEGFAALTAALREHGLGLLIDFVPNHMGISGGRNAWWQDVLENGRQAASAPYFDIEWRPLKRELRDKVLLPILGDQYGAVLERGELRLEQNDGAFQVTYFETPLPIAPPTYPLILRHPLAHLVERLPADDPALLEYQSIITALENLLTLDESAPDTVETRQREQVVAKRRLAGLIDTSEPIADALAATIATFNGHVGDPSSFDLLDNLLEQQAYRLSFWRVAGEEINYRRFFAINELAAIRQEEPEVFTRSHEMLLRLLTTIDQAGVRIDHPDGLWDPAGYFRQLQAAYATAISAPQPDDNSNLPLYVVIEKILEHHESLPVDWPVHGTVGYEFTTAVNNLFVDPAHRRPFNDLYAAFVGRRLNLTDLVYDAKQLMMRTALVSEVNVLAQVLNRISEENRHTRDFTLNSLRAALREVIATFPVYRTYLTAEERYPRPPDRQVIDTAVAQARRRNPTIDGSVFDFVRDVLLATPEPGAPEASVQQRIRFSLKAQQLTGPVMAKGLEDTAFYQYNRLTSLNEVGGNPGQFGAPVAAFHREAGQRQRHWPHALLSTSTHDTKRSEDVRARINVLSEMPQIWREAINRWTRLNRRHKRRLEGRAAPDRNDEYLLYQTLLGTWPTPGSATPDAEFVARMVAYMEKATREAQTHTSWLTPNEEYEAAATAFVEALLNPEVSEAFLADIATLTQPVAHFGAINGLGQQTLKLTAPGVPDVYQGTELWDFSLVDPDNRRPVDFTRRAQFLTDLVSLTDGSSLTSNLHDGRIKLFVTRTVLQLRRTHPDLFAYGDYTPLEVLGERAAHVLAFRRRLPPGAESPGQELVVAVPRLSYRLLSGQEALPTGPGVWGGTRLALTLEDAGATYRNVFTGATLRPGEEGDDRSTLHLGEVLATFPVAVLLRDEPVASAHESNILGRDGVQ